MIKKILSQMGFLQKPRKVTQFLSEEDGAPYHVWCVDYPEQSYILKRAKGNELEIYRTFFNQPCSYAPLLYATANADGADYLLMEYIPGNNLMKCCHEDLIRTLDSLIAMQQKYWLHDDPGNTYDRSLKGRRNRAEFLCNARLESAYNAYLQEFATLPRTLCHDDLLPFNVIISGDRAVFIDWEAGGILPYPTSLARLIAHTEDREEAFFYMTESDISFAIDYYYDNFLKGRGVTYDTYRRNLEFCLFYEYCEWVYVGNKYGETDNDRFRGYLQKSTEMAIHLGF